MDRKDLAKKLREALFDHIEAERREALQDAAIDKLFEGVLAKYESRPAWIFSQLGPMEVQWHDDGLNCDWSVQSDTGSTTVKD